jgi:glyceraldehyde 3-phosphate dehydrogenase
MSTPVGINGFGRIGRQILDLALDDPHLSVVAINDPFVDAEYIAYLIRHDSATARRSRSRTVEVQASAANSGSSPQSPSSPHSTVTGRNREPQCIIVDDRLIHVYGFSDPAQVPWSESKVQYVIDASGMFTTVERASAHLAGGSSRVVITAPSADAPTIVFGGNEQTFRESFQVISCGSCTALAAAPALKMLNDLVPIADCTITAIHASTTQQGAVDGTNRKDYRLGRSSNNIIPCPTGAVKSLVKVLPQLQGKIFATSVRVPVQQGSLLDVVVRFEKPVTKAQMDAMFLSASEDQSRYGKLIGYSKDAIVSSDVVGSTYSCIYDQPTSSPVGDDLTRHHLLLWYDNERGYAARVLDLVLMTAAQW